MKLQKAFKKAIKKGLQEDKWVYLVNGNLKTLRIHTEHKTLEFFKNFKRNNQRVTLDDVTRKDWYIVDLSYLEEMWKNVGSI